MSDPLDLQIALEHFDSHSDSCDQGPVCSADCCFNPGLSEAIDGLRAEIRAWHGIADALYTVVLAIGDHAPSSEMADLVVAYSVAKASRSKL